MTQDTQPIETIDPAALCAATGGGLLGAAWKLARKTYDVAHPYIENASPFGYLAYKAHSLWHKVTEKR
jgi:hypothetical protein